MELEELAAEVVHVQRKIAEAPDEYVGELMAFVRGVAADSETP